MILKYTFLLFIAFSVYNLPKSVRVRALTAPTLMHNYGAPVKAASVVKLKNPLAKTLFLDQVSLIAATTLLSSHYDRKSLRFSRIISS